MAAVIIVFVIWFTAVTALGLAAAVVAPRLAAPRWVRATRQRAAQAVHGSVVALGRAGTAAVLALAGWSLVIILGWLLGIAAHALQGPVDEPAFRWWQRQQVGGTWSDVWWHLTDIGAPVVTFSLTLAGALVTAVLYRRRAHWWAPSVILVCGYFAERYSQTILKLVVHRGHPPTTLGTWPSGGMARVLVVYGLVIYFVVARLWPRSPRAWALGWLLLAVCASVQAYARLNNLEHWTTDVIGGAIFGLLLLAAMITAYSAFRDVDVDVARTEAVPGAAARVSPAATRAGDPADLPARRPARDSAR